MVSCSSERVGGVDDPPSRIKFLDWDWEAMDFIQKNMFNRINDKRSDWGEQSNVRLHTEEAMMVEGIEEDQRRTAVDMQQQADGKYILLSANCCEVLPFSIY